MGIPGLLSQKKYSQGMPGCHTDPLLLAAPASAQHSLGLGHSWGSQQCFSHSFCSSLPPLHNHHLSQRCILSPLVPIFILPAHNRKQFETGGCPGAQHNPAVAGLSGQAGTLISAEPHIPGKQAPEPPRNSCCSPLNDPSRLKRSC